MYYWQKLPISGVNMYNAYCVVDLTGGMGVATARKMQEMGYQGGMYVDNVDTKTNGSGTLK
jgi:hypothetical protein